MTAEITLSRRDNRNEDQFFQATVWLEGEEVLAKCAEDVPEIKSATRYGPKEPFFTGYLRFREGEEIELSEEEELQAREAIKQIEAHFQGEIDRLKEDFKP